LSGSTHDTNSFNLIPKPNTNSGSENLILKYEDIIRGDSAWCLEFSKKMQTNFDIQEFGEYLHTIWINHGDDIFYDQMPKYYNELIEVLRETSAESKMFTLRKNNFDVKFQLLEFNDQKFLLILDLDVSFLNIVLENYTPNGLSPQFSSRALPDGCKWGSIMPYDQGKLDATGLMSLISEALKIGCIDSLNCIFVTPVQFCSKIWIDAKKSLSEAHWVASFVKLSYENGELRCSNELILNSFNIKFPFVDQKLPGQELPVQQYGHQCGFHTLFNIFSVITQSPFVDSHFAKVGSFQLRNTTGSIFEIYDHLGILEFNSGTVLGHNHSSDTTGVNPGPNSGVKPIPNPNTNSGSGSGSENLTLKYEDIIHENSAMWFEFSKNMLQFSQNTDINTAISDFGEYLYIHYYTSGCLVSQDQMFNHYDLLANKLCRLCGSSTSFNSNWSGVILDFQLLEYNNQKFLLLSNNIGILIYLHNTFMRQYKPFFSREISHFNDNTNPNWSRGIKPYNQGGLGETDLVPIISEALSGRGFDSLECIFVSSIYFSRNSADVKASNQVGHWVASFVKLSYNNSNLSFSNELILNSFNIGFADSPKNHAQQFDSQCGFHTLFNIFSVITQSPIICSDFTSVIA
jgi:hypothetical protein